MQLARSTPLMFGFFNKAAAGARLIENVRLLHDSSVTSSSSGWTSGSIGASAAESVGALMKGAASAAVVAGGRIEPRVATRGLVAPASGAVPLVHPDPVNPGPVFGISSIVMGDIVDALLAALRGDHQRVAADVADMARCQSIHLRTSSGIKPPRTTAQDWPRGSITDPAAVRRQPSTE